MTGDHILTIKVPVPVPAIKTFSRWRVFLALFDPRSHFTTCDTLKYQLHRETEVTTRKMVENSMNRKVDENLSVKKSWDGI